MNIKKLIPYKINSLNIGFDVNPSVEKKIFIFYHVYCGLNKWMEIFESQVNEIKHSGLLAYSCKLYISLIWSKSEEVDYVRSYLKDIDYEIFYSSNDGSCYEFPCLEKMYQLSVDNINFYCLYMHTKGASYNIKHYVPKYNIDFSQYCKNTESWRKLMEYFNIHKWNIAINTLNSGYDTYGCYYLPKERWNTENGHYSGNFWWTTSDYLKTLKPITADMKKDRYKAELWLINDKTKYYNAFTIWANLYYLNLSSSIYTKPIYTINNLSYILKHYLYVIKRIP